MIRKGRTTDINELARIHLKELHSQFLPMLGNKFLRLLYANFIKNNQTFVYVSERNKSIQGYIVGAKDFNNVFKVIILNNLTQFLYIIFPQILRKPKILINIFETIFYTTKTGVNKNEGELVVIVVVKKFRNRGIGKKLISVLEKQFYNQNLTEYKVSVTAKNKSAVSFYESLGFKKLSKFILYGNETYLYKKLIL